MASAAVPGLLLCFAAFVLLLIATLSVPIWDSVSFLNVQAPGQNVFRFGVFGYTGSHARLGYQISPATLGFNISGLNTTTVRNLTRALVLNPIACGFSFLAVLFGLCGTANSRVGTILMTIVSALALLATLVAFIIDMVLFGIARNRIRHDTPPGITEISAQYGNANWMVLGALVALILGICAGACGSFGRYSSTRRGRHAEKV